MTDAELLRAYVANGSEEAFRQLVERHAGLVYSAARRQCPFGEAAQDVAQAVFVEFSGKAAQLDGDMPLAPWLYAVARYKSLEWVRKESRRATRERVAGEDPAMRPEGEADRWRELEPMLDEGMATLSGEDRRAVLLRFFEQKSFREIAEQLGATEDAAQKRVSRALDRLQRFFARRGVVSTSGGLMATLTAHAVVPVPEGLVAKACAGAAAGKTAGGVTVAAEVARRIALTTTQKFMIAAAVAVLAVGAWQQANAVKVERARIRALEKEIGDWNGKVTVARLDRDHARAEVAATKHMTVLDPAGERQAAQVEDTVAMLKARLAAHPELAIPQLAYLTDADWLRVALRAGKLTQEVDFRRALADLRNAAREEFRPLLFAALKAYLADHSQLPPATAEDLAPYLGRAPEPGLLEQYTVVPTIGTIPNRYTRYAIADAPRTIVDPELEGLQQYTFGGVSTGWASVDRRQLNPAIMAARAAFTAAHPGQSPVDEEDLLPYFAKPADAERFKTFLHVQEQPWRQP